MRHSLFSGAQIFFFNKSLTSLQIITIRAGVSVHSGFYNKTPEAGLIKNRNVFLTVLGAGSLRSGYQSGQVT